MASTLMNRLKRIESNTMTDEDKIGAIFIHLVTPGELDKPVDGWSFGHGDNRVEVWRNADEDDERLRHRAADQCREQTGAEVARLISF